jgi:hypothetical protein
VDAAASTAELVALEPAPVEQWVWGMEFFARCAEVADSVDDREDLAARAIRALECAVAAGFADRRHLERSVFDSIRTRAEFVAIVDRLDATGR